MILRLFIFFIFTGIFYNTENSQASYIGDVDTVEDTRSSKESKLDRQNAGELLSEIVIELTNDMEYLEQNPVTKNTTLPPTRRKLFNK